MRIILYAILLNILFCPADTLADKASSANKKGVIAYRERKYDESARNFTEALIERPISPELKFNLGTALSEQNNTDEALRQLGAAAQELKFDDQQAAAHFNAGNINFLSGNLEGAIEEYKKAIRLDQSSEDIRHNLELAVRKLQQQKKEEQNKDGKKKDENKEEKNDTQKDTNNEENNEDKSDNQQSETKNSQDKDQQDQQSNQQMSEDRPMTTEEAQRILDALNDEEKKALSLRRMQMKNVMRQGDDW